MEKEIMTPYQTYSLWVSAVGALATFLAVGWVLFKETLLARFRRPVLNCSINMERPCVTKTKYKKFDKNGNITLDTKAYYYHLKVENTGRTEAKECIGYIEEVFKHDEKNEYKKVDNFIPLPLTWAHEGSIKTFIKSKQPKYLDIGHVVEAFGHNKGWNFIFCFLTRPYSELTEISEGKYKIKISIYFEHPQTKSIYLDIVWNGKWDAKYNNMISNLYINEGKKEV